LVLLEAMAQGTPVVSTAELGTRSILTADCGAYVVPEEEETFAAAVGEALQLAPDSPRRVQLRAHAESWASLAMARRLLAFYERVVAAHSHRINERGPLGTPLRVERNS
jgi:glycosyltransferase involved in cell wall biosynthesis